MNNLIPSNIVDGKRGKEGEFFVNLFEWCNMRCSFCWQDHTDWTGIETIIPRALDIAESINRDRKEYFIVNLMGGELFADEIPESTFVDYREMVKLLKKSTQKKFDINWVTNLVFKDTKRVTELVDYCRSLGITTNITTSFDFAGRFAKEQKAQFRSNLYHIREYVRTISVVLTKGNIETFMSRKDEVFESIYNDGFTIYFDYYSPESRHKYNAPSDLLLQQGLIYLVKNYPNVLPIKDWITKDSNEMTCRGSVIVDHTGIKGQCRSLLTKDMTTKMTSPVNTSNNKSMESQFISKYDCMSCEFYQKCGMGCFLQHDFKGREELDECLYKEVFRQI